MTRFWAIQHTMFWIVGILTLVFDFSWWTDVWSIVGLLVSGFGLMSSCKADDRRRTNIVRLTL